MRIPFHTVNVEVEKLYLKKCISEKQIREHVEFIHDFVVSCGYSWDEYLNLSFKSIEN